MVGNSGSRAILLSLSLWSCALASFGFAQLSWVEGDGVVGRCLGAAQWCRGVLGHAISVAFCDRA